MQPPTYCPTHIYMLVVTLNESVSYQQLFTPTKSTVMAASVTPDLHDNVPLNFKVQVRNSLSDTFYETGITRLCKYTFTFNSSSHAVVVSVSLMHVCRHH